MKRALALVPFLAVMLAAVGCRSAPLLEFGEVPDFTATTTTGAKLSRADLLGAPWVASFVFTRCPGPCPMMGAKMRDLGGLLPAGVRRISVTVDPAHDTPEVLAGYASSYEAQEPEWTFATLGDTLATEALMVQGFKLGLALPAATTEGSAPEIVHSTKFALVDARGSIRGYYDPFEADGLKTLARDATRLLEESR